MGRPKKIVPEGTLTLEKTKVKGWSIDRYDVVVRLLEPLLGTVPASKSIWAEHIAKKQAAAMKKEGLMTDEQIKEEIESNVEGVSEIDPMRTGLTGFLSDAKGRYLAGYMLKGYMKNAAMRLKEYGEEKQLKAKVTNYLFIRPGKIYVARPRQELEVIERPLRAEGPQGVRVAIARSECIPEGTELKFQVVVLNEVISTPLLKDLLAYGEWQGLGQWRNSGHGSFEVVSVTSTK